jgi:uncharacterized MAPEG superfamily protein
MSIPSWMLLAFATWTLLLLMFTVGIYRWHRILLKNAGIASFRADARDDADWYARATRAHANCIENLPVFAVIVFVLNLSAISGSLVNGIAISIMIARVLQTLTHVLFIQTNRAVSFRFSFFFVQLIGFLTLIVIIADKQMI